VRVLDVREGGGAGGGKGGTTLLAADSAVSFVQWSPVDENVLISCSHDYDIKLWDVRSVSLPLCTCLHAYALIFRHTECVKSIDLRKMSCTFSASN